MKERIEKALDFLGGKKTYYIICGVVIGLFLISSIVVAVNKSNSKRSPDESAIAIEADASEGN